jgi:hypothetical protein
VLGLGTPRQRSAVRRAMLGLHFCRASMRRHVGELYVRLYLQCCAANIFLLKEYFFQLFMLYHIIKILSPTKLTTKIGNK